MAWTTPTSWTPGLVPDNTAMNREIRDNLMALKDPPSFSSAYTARFSANPTSYSSLPISAVLGTYGGDVLCHLECFTDGGGPSFNLLIDGSGYTSAASGITFIPAGGASGFSTYSVWVTGLSSGTHTFQPVVRRNGASYVTFENEMVHLRFWAREVS